MAAFVLIAFSVGVDLYKVGVRCWSTKFTFANILAELRDIHDEVRDRKYLECINEIYQSNEINNNSDFHRIGIACVNCRRKMICDKIENAIEVDGCEEAFEVISIAVSTHFSIDFPLDSRQMANIPITLNANDQQHSEIHTKAL